jgi:hypothetical protein
MFSLFQLEKRFPTLTVQFENLIKSKRSISKPLIVLKKLPVVDSPTPIVPIVEFSIKVISCSGKYFLHG